MSLFSLKIYIEERFVIYLLHKNKEGGIALKKITGRLFGSFHIAYLDHVMEEKDFHSTKLIMMLSYLMIYHARKITAAELEDILWSDEEINNPRNALKNLSYRLRKVLKESLGVNDLFVGERGTFCWNSEYAIEIDTEQFERLEEILKEKKDVNEENLDELKDTLYLYKGKLLPAIASSHWVISLVTYYHSLYLKSAKRLAVEYGKQRNFKVMSEICKDALVIDALDDETQYLFIKSMLMMNHVDLAKKQYYEATRLLYENLGVRQSPYLQKVYMELMEGSRESEDDLDSIQDELTEEEERKAFSCEYGVFKEIYHLDMRRAERHGIAEYVVLFTLVGKSFTSNDEQHLQLLKKEMEKLEYALSCSLRTGDVISKYSGNQYIMLLYACTAENIQMIVQRLMDKYASCSKHQIFEIEYTYDEIGS